MMEIKYWETWLKAAGVRAIRTFAESALAYIGTGAIVLGDVNWLGVLSAGLFGAICSVLLAMTGLPEAGERPDYDEDFWSDSPEDHGDE